MCARSRVNRPPCTATVGNMVHRGCASNATRWWTGTAHPSVRSKPPAPGHTASATEPSSARAAAEEHHLERLDQDHQVKEHVVVLDVEEVVLEFLRGVFFRSTVGIRQLRPTGKARFQGMPQAVV